MSYFIYDNTGRILSAYSDEPIVLEDQNLLIGELSPLDGNRYYVENGALVEKPQPPSLESYFDYTTKQWVDMRTEETQWIAIREERNRRLQSTDWTQLPDVPTVTKTMWEPYRQALRDITLQPDPFNITWPTPPQ